MSSTFTADTSQLATLSWVKGAELLLQSTVDSQALHWRSQRCCSATYPYSLTAVCPAGLSPGVPSNLQIIGSIANAIVSPKPSQPREPQLGDLYQILRQNAAMSS